MTLRKFTPKELIKLAESFTSRYDQPHVMKRIFEQIEKDRNENEYNRTCILDRANELKDAANRLAFDLNSSNGVRLLETIDSSIKKSSYVNKVAGSNIEHLKRTTNNFLGA